jgi:hypothetical protein
MTSDPKLSFTEFLNPDGAEFPQCCRSGFWMTYNTHLRDPARFYAPRTRSKVIVQKELSRVKRKSSK